MSQTVNADSGPVISSSQIDYKQSMYSHPSYRFSPQFSNTFGQPFFLGASQTPVTVNIPPEVFNLSQSSILYSVNIPPNSLGTYTWHAQQVLK